MLFGGEIDVNAGLSVGRKLRSELTHSITVAVQVLGIPGPKVMFLLGKSNLLVKTQSSREGWPKT